MENASIARGRKIAARMFVAQAVATLLAALGFWLFAGARPAGAAFVGGLIPTVALGFMALRVLKGGVQGPGPVLGSLVVGLMMKWVLIAVGFYLALAVLKLPTLPLFAGFVAAFSAQFVAGILKV